MNQPIDRSDTDFNTVFWQDDSISIARHSDSHVRVSRYKHRLGEPSWTILIDATSGHRALSVADGNRLACVADRHLLAITCGEHTERESLHNFQLHYIDQDGQVLWSRPWQTIQRFTLIDDLLLVVRYVSPPQIWIDRQPLEAHLLDPTSGESVAVQQIAIPDELLPHYQSWQVSNLRCYLVWRKEELVLTVRPYFFRDYIEQLAPIKHAMFRTVLSFDKSER